jgi:hypothetical protein
MQDLFQFSDFHGQWNRGKRIQKPMIFFYKTVEKKSKPTASDDRTQKVLYACLF